MENQKFVNCRFSLEPYCFQTLLLLHHCWNNLFGLDMHSDLGTDNTHFKGVTVGSTKSCQELENVLRKWLWLVWRGIVNAYVWYRRTLDIRPEKTCMIQENLRHQTIRKDHVWYRRTVDIRPSGKTTLVTDHKRPLTSRYTFIVEHTCERLPQKTTCTKEQAPSQETTSHKRPLSR